MAPQHGMLIKKMAVLPAIMSTGAGCKQQGRRKGSVG